MNPLQMAYPWNPIELEVAFESAFGRNPDERAAESRSNRKDACLLARGELSLRRANLSERKSPARTPAHTRRYQASPAWALGHHKRTQFYLYASQPADQRAGSQHDLRHRTRTRRSWHCRSHVSRGLLFRNLSEHRAEPRRNEAPVPTILVAVWDPQPRRAGNSRLDSRGRRARLLTPPRLRRRLRQSRFDCCLHRRGRRSRDGPLPHKLALENDPRCRRARRGFSDPASQRLQDCQTDRLGAHLAERAGIAVSWLRLQASLS